MSEQIALNQESLHDTSLAYVFLRNEFYTHRYRQLVVVLLISISFNAILGSIVYWEWSSAIPPVYFATDPTGRVLQDLPLENPVLTDDQVKSFALKATQRVLSMDYKNFRATLQYGRQFFTDGAFDEYLLALKASHNLETVRQQKMVTRAELVGDMTIQNRVIDGRYFWRVTIPMNVIYQGENNKKRLKIIQPISAQLTIGRVYTTQSLYAILIEQILIADRVGTK